MRPGGQPYYENQCYLLVNERVEINDEAHATGMCYTVIKYKFESTSCSQVDHKTIFLVC